MESACPAPAEKPPAEGPRAEANAIHAALFAVSAPEQVVRRYEAALAVLPLEPSPVQAAAVWASPRRLAALEYFLRVTRRRNGLTQRFQVLFYIAELEPELFPRFARARASRFGGLLDLARAVLAAPLYFVSGLRRWRRGSDA